MIFLYPLASFWPAGRTKKRYRQAYTGRPAPFLWICRAGGYGAQNAFQGQHADKTGGFQRGPMPPLWHTTLLARCSVLYLPAWLTGEAGRAMRFMSCLDRQKNGRRDCRLECARMTAGFAERGQGYASYLWARHSGNHFICRKHIEIKDKLLYPT